MKITTLVLGIFQGTLILSVIPLSVSKRSECYNTAFTLSGGDNSKAQVLTQDAISFIISNLTAQKSFREPHPDLASMLEAVKELPEYQENDCTEILQMTNFSSNVNVNREGFVRAVIDAYSRHHNLVIKPDDIWAAIITQFSFYINKHAQAFRDKFVNFDGKKTLAVSVVGSLRNAPYDHLVKLMSSEIHKNLMDPQIRDWILPNFTTTTENDIVTMGVIFMAATKEYFKYEGNLLCGIPRITLEGSVDDWRNVYGRLENLKEFKLDEWYELLEPIINQFVDAREGRIDVEFWQGMVNKRDPGCGDSFISGWITAFSRFDLKGNLLVSTRRVPYGPETRTEANLKSKRLHLSLEDIPRGVVEVDMKINDNGAEYNGLLFAGQFGTVILDDGKTIRPSLGWVIALKPSDSNNTGALDTL